jgi:hypothetical protein
MQFFSCNMRECLASYQGEANPSWEVRRKPVLLPREENLEELVMKSSRKVVGLVGASLLLAISAVAGTENKGTLRLYDNVNVQGKQLTPGNYKVEWNGDGPEVQVNIVDGGKTIATVQARVVPVTLKNTQDGYTASSENGTRTLKELSFHGKSYDLQLEAGSGSGTSQPGSPQ